MIRRVWRGVLAAVAVTVLVGLILYQARPRPRLCSATWWDVFDTVVSLSLYVDSEAENQRQSEAIHDDLLRYHQLFDAYHEYDGLTNLATLNAHAAEGPVPVEDDLMALLAFGKQAAEATDGACNIAAGAVLTLWHDARDAIEAAQSATDEGAAETDLAALLPSEDALAAAAQHIDINDLVLNEEAGTVYFADPELQLDVGAIAKGWAVEQAARAAEARGLESALLNAGGSVRAIGTKPDGARWTAGVQNPEGGALLAEVALEPGQSLIVSGDYQRYVVVNGTAYHHLIDLQTQQPARYNRSVAILSGDAGWGDALSTALFCLPANEGEALLANFPDTAVQWMTADGTMQETANWPAR